MTSSSLLQIQLHDNLQGQVFGKMTKDYEPVKVSEKQEYWAPRVP